MNHGDRKVESNEPRVLVVDDEPGVLGLLRMSVQHYGL